MTPLFPGWHLPTLRRKPKTDIQKHLENERLNQTRSITDLSNILSRYIPKSSFDDKFKKGTRKRLFSLENTFWGFFINCSILMVAVSPLSINLEHHYSLETKLYLQTLHLLIVRHEKNSL